MRESTRSSRGEEVRTFQIYLLIFNVLCQNRELLLHDAVLALVAEGGLALGCELVFEAIPMTSRVLTGIHWPRRREPVFRDETCIIFSPVSHTRGSDIPGMLQHISTNDDLSLPQVVDFRIDVVLHLVLRFSEFPVEFRLLLV